jgi:hypothetical protein
MALGTYVKYLFMKNFKFIEQAYLDLIEKLPNEIVDLQMVIDLVAERHPNFLIFYDVPIENQSEDNQRNLEACLEKIEIIVDRMHKKLSAKPSEIFSNQIEIDFGFKYMQKRYKFGNQSIPLNLVELYQWKELHDRYMAKANKGRKQAEEVEKYVQMKFKIDIEQFTIIIEDEELRTNR